MCLFGPFFYLITIKAQVNAKSDCRSPAPAGDFTDLTIRYNRSQGRAPTSSIVYLSINYQVLIC